MQLCFRWCVVGSALWSLSVAVDSIAIAETTAERVNNGTVAVMTGEVGGAGIQIASDLASVLNEGDKLRVLPVVGQGSLKNIEDLLYLKGVGLAIVQEDVLSFVQEKSLFPNIIDKIHYISKLYSEEVHIITRSDITDISELASKKVNFESQLSGNFITAQAIFDTFQITVDPVFLDTALGIEKVKSGEITASVLVTGKPSGAIAAINSDDQLHLLPVHFDSGLRNEFKPATLEANVYPDLLWESESIPTVKVDTYLMVFNFEEDGWRYNKIARFVDAYLDRSKEFLDPPRHPKWNEADLSANLSGWTRFRPAEEWLKRNAAVASNGSNDPSLRREFQEFLAYEAERPDGSVGPEVDREELFRRFLSWQRQKQAGSDTSVN